LTIARFVKPVGVSGRGLLWVTHSLLLRLVAVGAGHRTGWR
jgi:hypothetical protein